MFREAWLEAGYKGNLKKNVSDIKLLAMSRNRYLHLIKTGQWPSSTRVGRTVVLVVFLSMTIRIRCILACLLPGGKNTPKCLLHLPMVVDLQVLWLPKYNISAGTP